MGLKPRVQLDVTSRSEKFLVDTGANYSVLTVYSEDSSSQTCTILGATGKTIRKRLTQALLCCWDGQVFPHQLLVVPECPTSLLGRDPLPLKSCSYCSPDKKNALKLSFGGKLTIFTIHQVKQLLNGRGHLWMSSQRILGYQVVMMENPGLTISLYKVLNPVTLLPTPKGPFILPRNFGSLGKTPRGIVRRSSGQS